MQVDEYAARGADAKEQRFVVDHRQGHRTLRQEVRNKHGDHGDGVIPAERVTHDGEDEQVQGKARDRVPQRTVTDEGDQQRREKR